ncbi:hypothetical protein LOCC1_G001169 [Lachnellula occidentalis]|uniref:Yeast cell wall synthesis Kre9/Knh1-like N-terminal domain-containing protein n=1 Tax=Lachnellula occidentalis TaxID=215460 RepID=A0A8H8S8H1_9HELO|nr:hypothetical protein LOCC1_G001169 [Lachnellula occidentalis]
MLFTQSLFALAAFTSAVLASDPTASFDPITSPSTKDQQVPAGSAFTITWQASTYTADSDTVSIVLMAGNDPATLVPGATIASVKNSLGSYTWTVPSSTAVTYGFRISLDSDATIFQYSFPFHISGGSAVSSVSSSAAVSSTSAIAGSSVTSSPAVSSQSSLAVAGASSLPYCAVASTSIIYVTASAYQTSTMTKVASATSVPALNTTLAAPTTYAWSNSTSVGATKTAPTVVGGSTGTPSGSGSGSTTTPPVMANAAGSNMAQGGFALVAGLVLALAL